MTYQTKKEIYMSPSEVEPDEKSDKIKTKNNDNIYSIPIWMIGVIVGIALGITTAWWDKTYAAVSNGFIVALLSSLIGIVIDHPTNSLGIVVL